MASLSRTPVRVSPADPTDDDEVRALKNVMREDSPYPDECPTLEAAEFDPCPWSIYFLDLSPAQLAALGWAESD